MMISWTQLNQHICWQLLPWLPVRRENGRGEGFSGLAFDRLEAAPGSNK
jgi:hypothetical protein